MKRAGVRDVTWRIELDGRSHRRRIKSSPLPMAVRIRVHIARSGVRPIPAPRQIDPRKLCPWTGTHSIYDEQMLGRNGRTHTGECATGRALVGIETTALGGRF